jgi:hypothetical protein
MPNIEFGGAGEIPPAELQCPMDEFENAIRKIGVVAACEWFGYLSDSAFTEKTIQILKDRSNS